MFEFNITNASDAIILLDEYGRKVTKAVTVIQRGADFHSRGPHHLVVPMSDVTSPSMSPDAPTREHLEQILAFTADLTDDDYLLVNCWAGQSRSTAVAIAILIQHGWAPLTALTLVVDVRPVAMPNLLIIQHADDHFGLNGELVMAVTAYIKSELQRARILPSEPSKSEVDEMKKFMGLF